MVVLLLCACLLLGKAPAQSNLQIISKTDVGLIIGGIAASGAVIGVVVYYAVSHANHSLKGCASSGSNGLELQSESDQRTFLLKGITADVKPGDRVSLKGKKMKAPKGSSGSPAFLVEKLTKDYGACGVPAPNR